MFVFWGGWHFVICAVIFPVNLFGMYLKKKTFFLCVFKLKLYLCTAFDGWRLYGDYSSVG